MGPVVHGGCGALCPSNGRGCYGCYGPSSTANFSSLVNVNPALERFPGESLLLIRNFTRLCPAFRKAADLVLKAAAGKESILKNIEVPALARVEGEGGLFIG